VSYPQIAKHQQTPRNPTISATLSVLPASDNHFQNVPLFSSLNFMFIILR
jgi:hypothetical protein